ncbi:MAG TPA: TIGR03088 family PEP-CTERM/XrtA system glycosyltransferase [Burkholderiaceae bacterium]|nr:TIGR03088 family PEP-CTERM/XrtA system glycosyltransferase [Burkholderiaceae bacterium]
MAIQDQRPLVAHVLHRFDVGGLENGVVNLINRMPADRFRHAVIAMTEIGSDFRRRVQRDDVQFHALNKPSGQGLRVAPRLVRLLREMRPALVHTRNLGALEMTLPAAWAGVPVRVHGEHGWDTNDPDGRSVKYRLVRRLYRPLVHRYVALSGQLRRYLHEAVGVPADRIEQIYNGVDTQRFEPANGVRAAIGGSPFSDPALWLVGTVGRLQPIKDQALLARAFVRSLELDPTARSRMRLVIVGDGPSRPQVEQILRDGGVAPLSWVTGERADVPEVMRGLDAFVLPSRAEGISNTILEAMATALPIVATAVGGNGELLDDGVTGRLVPASDVERLARAMLDDLHDPTRARQRGAAARQVVQRRFSLEGMVASYGDLYQRLLTNAALRCAPQRA